MTDTPMNINRRSVLALGLAASVAAVAFPAASAQAAGQRTTIIYTPHPDDETLRLSGYASYAQARGDRLILVAVTDGGSTYLTQDWGWTPQMMMDHRIVEQTHAWSAVTKGLGQIIRLRITDGDVPNHTAQITAMAQQLDAQYGPNVEHYVAADDSDYHPDHRATVAGVRAAGVLVIRTALDRGNHNGMVYYPSSVDDATLAYNAYHTIGWQSVPDSFKNLHDEGFSSYVH